MITMEKMIKKNYIRPELEVIVTEAGSLLDPSQNTPNAGGNGADTGGGDAFAKPNANPFGWQSVGWDDGTSQQQ